MRERREHERLVDHRVARKRNQRRVLLLQRHLRRTVERRACECLVQAGDADDLHRVVRRLGEPPETRSVAVAVTARIVGAERRPQAIVEVGQRDRVVPRDLPERVVEPRSVPADTERRPLIRPGRAERRVVGALVDRQRDLDRVVERERRAPRLIAVALRRLERRIDVDGVRQRIQDVRGAGVAFVPEVELPGEGVVDRSIGERPCSLCRVAARGRRRAGRAGHAHRRFRLHRRLRRVGQREVAAVQRVRRACDIAEVQRNRRPVEVAAEFRAPGVRTVPLIAVADVRCAGVQDPRRTLAVEEQVSERAAASIAVAFVAGLVAVGRRPERADIDGAMYAGLSAGHLSDACNRLRVVRRRGRRCHWQHGRRQGVLGEGRSGSR